MHSASSPYIPSAFTFRNIGPIREAALELGDLTIISGRNNTGKTYLVHTLYGFLKCWSNWCEPAHSRRAARYPTFERMTEQAAETGRATFPVERPSLSHERRNAAADLTGEFSEGLAAVLDAPPGHFENASMSMRLTVDPPWNSETGDALPGSEDSPVIRYDGTDLSLVMSDGRPGNEQPTVPRVRLWHRYLAFLLPELPSDPFALSAERFGISLFYKELDSNKSRIVDLMQTHSDRGGKDRGFPFHTMNEAVSRCSRPILDNIDYARSIPDLRHQKSDVHDNRLFNDIKRLMNGYYAVSENATEFRSTARGERRFTIPLHLASSSARGLSDLYLFLRHAAKKNQILMIDDPESHLDTGNQRLLARVLARMVHAGLKVVLTTHSDYLVKELNNLIMLNSSFDDKARILEKLKYATDDCIAPERIRAYTATENTLKKCRIDKFGIDMPHFDETIDEINAAANELCARLASHATD